MEDIVYLLDTVLAVMDLWDLNVKMVSNLYYNRITCTIIIVSSLYITHLIMVMHNYPILHVVGTYPIIIYCCTVHLCMYFSISVVHLITV